MGAPSLRKHANIDMLNVGSGDGDRNDVFRLAGSRTRMAPDAAGVIDDLGPFDSLRRWLCEHCCLRLGYDA